MTGLISKDFIVFKKKFNLLYRLAFSALLAFVVLLLPKEGITYEVTPNREMGGALLWTGYCGRGVLLIGAVSTNCAYQCTLRHYMENRMHQWTNTKNST